MNLESVTAQMPFYMAAVAVGNLLTSAVNFFIANPNGSSRLTGASYFWFFTGLMLITAVGFVWHSRNFKEHTYLQEDH